mgnify:CR=1 FL=1|jgi:predicted DNA-binding protein (UPF0278 family)
MKDSDFKQLAHQIGALRIGSSGSQVSAGYKPDITIVDASGKVMFILESEQKTDRKAFLGDVLKAEKYSEECNATPTLVIVMQQQSNTTVKQIANHIHLYISWLRMRVNGGMRLAGLLVISDTEYLASVQAREIIGSSAFRARGVTV